MTVAGTIFLTGGTGSLGRYICPRLPSDNLVVTSKTPRGVSGEVIFDAANASAFSYPLIGDGDLVIYMAAISSPDGFQGDWDRVKEINVAGTGYFIEQALERGAEVLFLSSDTVYGHGDEAVDETAPVNPSDSYAKMKYDVERLFHGHPNFKVFRLSYVVSPFDKFNAYLRRCAQQGETAEVFNPFDRCVVGIDDLFSAMKAVIADWDAIPSSLVNICGPKLVSKVDMVHAFQECVDSRLKFEIVEPPVGFFDHRPARINLTSKYLSALLGRQPAGLTEIYSSLRDYRTA